MKVLKHSRQREFIRTCLMNCHDHLTADALCANIREEFPNISLGTVYRNLSLLAEASEIWKPICGDGAVCFDGDVHQYYHFVYSEYNQVYGMELDAMEGLNKGAREHTPGIVNNYYALLYG